MNTLTEVIDYLRTINYHYNFDVKNDRLICKETGEKFIEEELIIDKFYRFEGDSNPDDMSVLYAMTAISGTKGIIIDAFGTYSDSEISAFIKNVPEREN